MTSDGWKPATGNPDDDRLLIQIAARAPLDRPRRWRHYLCVPDEVPAQVIARALLATGIWEAEISAPQADGEPYTVIASRPDVVLTAYLVRSTREMFEQTASLVPDAEYDGWEVSQ
jgi:hypothetical protein